MRHLMRQKISFESYLLKWQQKKFFSVHDFLEVLEGEFVRPLMQLLACVGIFKKINIEMNSTIIKNFIGI
jgi:hypothetical protein